MGTKPLVAALLLLTGGAGPADGPRHLVVLELFTSEGCSSCPPADALLNELAGRPDLLPLAFHVTYWNGLGWKDPYSLDAATVRQHAYAATLGQDTVYTPELVIDGRRGVVGSNRTTVAAALRAASHDPSAPTVSLRGDRNGLSVDIGGGNGTGTGTIWLVAFDHHRQTTVGRGENSGRTLLESNIVRSIRQIGTWSGTPLHLNTEPGAGEGVAALLQASDGHILNAARLEGGGL